MNTEFFSAADLRDWIRQTSTVRPQIETYPQGWSLAKQDPAETIRAFTGLYVKEGFTLHAYQFKSSMGANSLAFALPRHIPCPAPASGASPSAPAEALEHVMDAISGDGSGRSYIEASIFLRELLEWGARWHGLSWRLHKVLGNDTWTSPTEEEDGSQSELTLHKIRRWRWLEPTPENWAPRVSEQADSRIVTFYTFSRHRAERIYRHVDRYKFGSYTPTSEKAVMATGGAGYFT